MVHHSWVAGQKLQRLHITCGCHRNGNDERSKKVGAIRAQHIRIGHCDNEVRRPELPLAGVKTVDELVDESFAIDRFSVVLFSSFGLVGLLLAAVGIYSVMSFGVAQRTKEFGIRMALGAQRLRVIRQVVTEGVILALVGSLVGLGGAYLVGRAMQSTLYGVGAMDVGAFGAVASILIVAALLACLFPAWRASRVEPIEALRHE